MDGTRRKHRKPLVPGFWSSYGLVGTVFTSKAAMSFGSYKTLSSFVNELETTRDEDQLRGSSVANHSCDNTHLDSRDPFSLFRPDQ